MKILSPSAHGVIDVSFITFVALAPILFDLAPAVDTACFVLAGGYLLVTLLTDFRLGLLRLIPFPVHGWLDLFTGLALVAVPFLFHFEANSAERNLFLGLGIFSIIVWFVTDWKAQTRSLMTDRG
ncbi:hypothetical protein [Hymenobacter chitinivorans]|uniref:SPW repeat-containing protein n=1 Tax=Hymenobacter chitinivorans DSM 11115 TaxID=1121954 RepID=A0A2M9B9E8_9BACT|nr:hypothetical protein [Hymenobacter chitinivorans]PJJ54556.1 hypothetical protein CLV45_2897 [Hymenobacter chitinivorans DSM 11115]